MKAHPHHFSHFFRSSTSSTFNRGSPEKAHAPPSQPPSGMPRPRSQRPASAAGGGEEAPPAAGAGAATAPTTVAPPPQRPAPPRPPLQAAPILDGSSASESLAYGHHSRVFDVALRRGALGDPFSYLLASAGEDEVVRVWRRREKIDDDDAMGDDDDLDRRRSTTTIKTSSTPTSSSSSASSDFHQLAALRGHGEPVLRVAWGPLRSRLLASAGGDRAARIWKIEGEEDGEEERGEKEEKPENENNDAKAAPPPSSSRSASSDRFRQAAVLADHPEEVYACEITGDSKSCVTASASAVFLWDLETGKRVSAGGNGGEELPPPQPATTADGSDGSSSSLPPRWAAAHVFSATLSPESSSNGNNLVAAACSDGCLRLWSLTQGGGEEEEEEGTGTPSPLPPLRLLLRPLLLHLHLHLQLFLFRLSRPPELTPPRRPRPAVGPVTGSG